MNTLLPNGQLMDPMGYNLGYSSLIQPTIHDSFVQPLLPIDNFQTSIYETSNLVDTWRGGWEEPEIDYWKTPYTYPLDY